MFHVTKVATVLARCDFRRSLKDIAHRVDVPEAAFVCDHFHAVMTFFQPTASCFDAKRSTNFAGVVFISFVKTRAKLRGLIATRCASSGT
jgi:hypothetical protein